MPGLIFSSNIGLEQLKFLNKDCILKLDGARLDLKRLKEISVGAYLLDLTGIYSSLLQYEDQKRYLDMDDENTRSFYESSGILNLELSGEQGKRIGEWILSLRKLFFDTPLGIRIPANFIERDIVLAATWDIDFIVLECTDAINDNSIQNVVLPSLPALARAVNMINKLPRNNIRLIMREPFRNVNHLKMFALGCTGLIMNEANFAASMMNVDNTPSVLEGKPKSAYEVINDSLNVLKRDLHFCGCNNISKANKTLLLTSSEAIKNSTSINHIFDPDLISFSYYNLNKTSKRSRLK